jgi:hypothetical protein
MITWSANETLVAADKVSCLSELLEQEDFFKQGALQWLKSHHVNKFLAAIDVAESTRLMRFAAAWHYPDVSDSSGFPLLDWLWHIDIPSRYVLNHQSARTANRIGDLGRQLVSRLAEFQPAWVVRWWIWRCAQGRAFNDVHLKAADDAVINALSQKDAESYLPVLGDETVAAVIGRRPDLLNALPQERRGLALRQALEDESFSAKFVEELSEHGIPSNVVAVVDSVLDSGDDDEPDVTRRLNGLVTRWQGPPGSDPVAMAVKRGHERLEVILRSRWPTTNLKSRSRGDDNLWPVVLGVAGSAFASAARVSPERFRLELGYSIGLRIAGEEAEPSPEKVSDHLKNVGIIPLAGMVDALLPMVKLWASLRTLAKYQSNSWQHDTEIVGLRAKVVSLAAAAPDLWAQSLPWILARASAIGDVAQAVTIELAASAPEVREALDNTCDDEVEEVRLKASGLRTLLLGLEDDEFGLARTLADAAAHYMDGSPIFPHPLEAVSHTWLGSLGVERAIASGVRRATGRFAAEVRDQGADIEEALTKALVKEIEVEFREIRPRLKLLGSSSSRSQTPVLSVRQRPSSKQTEEPVYGCDLAWLLNATVRGRYALTWVDLVQVKKSLALQRRGGTASRADSWKIECKQLNDILHWSPTATYWLIASGGEVLVIPAKHLLAIGRGSKRGAVVKTFTVGYQQVRSAAIPLEQYLVDLLIGQWVGTSSDEVISFAQGGNSNIRPRVVVEVTIAVSLDNQ